MDNIGTAGAGAAVVSIVNPVTGARAQVPRAPTFRVPDDIHRLLTVGAYRVATRPVYAEGRAVASLRPVAYVQYGRSTVHLRATVARVRLQLLLGVLVAAVLALIGGMVLARRAMASINALTHAAKQVARSRDPADALAQVSTGGEVGELVETLQRMLSNLAAARGDTESTLARQREFAANASHELRTPLTSILGNLEVLALNAGGKQQETISAALGSARHMRDVAADLLLSVRREPG
jgi:signal transduction histidine kinase